MQTDFSCIFLKYLQLPILFTVTENFKQKLENSTKPLGQNQMLKEFGFIVTYCL